MTGYWQSEYSDDKLRTREDVRDLINCEVDVGNDNNEFSEWLAERDDRIVSEFIDCEGYCNDLYDKLKEEFIDFQTDDMWECRGDDYELFGNNFVWHEDKKLRTISVMACTTITFDEATKTKEQAIAEVFPNAKDLSIVVTGSREDIAIEDTANEIGGIKDN